MNFEHIMLQLAHSAGFLPYLFIFLVIFAESGLFFGFFLPGDSFLFLAGLLASKGLLNPLILIPVCFFAAVLGVSVGYWFGQKYGKKLFHKSDSLFFHKENLEKARAFYEKHGKKTIVLARFIPFIRTFAPIVAGIGDMDYKIFIIFNIVGALLWAVGITLAGFYLGQFIPNVDKFLIPIILVIIVVTTAPAVFHMLKDKKTRTRLVREFKKALRFSK
ncbi:DedA family protein [Candidatus Roizmanbacteria bacterium]|nr:DedA family protein [Candidatus Roizmanbacteria bacterium]